MVRIETEEEVVETRVKQAELKYAACGLVSDGDDVWFKRAEDSRADASAVMYALHGIEDGHIDEVTLPKGVTIESTANSDTVRFHYGNGCRAVDNEALQQLIRVARGDE